MCWADRIGLVWAVSVGALFLWGISSVPPPPPSNPVSVFLLICGPWLLCRALDFIAGGPRRRSAKPGERARTAMARVLTFREGLQRDIDTHWGHVEILPPRRPRQG